MRAQVGKCGNVWVKIGNGMGANREQNEQNRERKTGNRERNGWDRKGKRERERDKRYDGEGRMEE